MFNSVLAPTSNSMTMCVETAQKKIYDLRCVTMKFDVVPSPGVVPGNSGQLIALNFPGSTLQTGDQVLWVSSAASCSDVEVVQNGVQTGTFANAHERRPSVFSGMATVGSSGAALVFDMSAMGGSANILLLCVKDSGTNGTVFALPQTKLQVTAAVVGLAGDPHVRAADGKWLDFYGEAGVYQLFTADHLQANAKFGYAVRDHVMIWHPKVMRPGTFVEEVGVTLLDVGATVRLAVYGGGIVSIRESLKSPVFWSGATSYSMSLGEYKISWKTCSESVAVPWGTHHRSQVLAISVGQETLKLFVAQSGGYRFIDVEAAAGSHASSGLLADALRAPVELSRSLASGQEKQYLQQVDLLPSL
jgi:hypothetical protein